MTAGPVINCEVALARMGGDRRLLGQLAEFFLTDAPAMMKELETALKNDDLQGVSQAAHSLKGLVSNFEAVSATAAARQVELLKYEKSLDGAAPLVDALRREVDAVSEALALIVSAAPSTT